MKYGSIRSQILNTANENLKFSYIVYVNEPFKAANHNSMHHNIYCKKRILENHEWKILNKFI